MSKIITNPKNYTGEELATIFFRPMLCGQSAQQLGIRILYNMPVPTTLNFWRRGADPLKPYAAGWSGGDPADKFQKTIAMKKVKAEMGYAAADYFNMVYEKMAAQADYNLADLSGSELETAETELFKAAITEGIRATMWLGDTTRATGFNTFDGILKNVKADCGTAANDITKVAILPMTTEGNGEKLLRQMYAAASSTLKTLKNEGQLVFMVTRDVYENYEFSLMNGGLDSARQARIDGIETLNYRGIPVVDMGVDNYLATIEDLPKSMAMLTDRRNLALAVNTSDFPGAEVAMWYNPDELENRQRAIFLAGADYLLPELIVTAF